MKKMLVLILVVVLVLVVGCKRDDRPWAVSTVAVPTVAVPTCTTVLSMVGDVPNTSLTDPHAGSEYVITEVCK